jgi:hypothetical protein
MGTSCEIFNEFSDLIDRFQGLPIVGYRKTYMDISGYPHYENVCSNILAFYFDQKEEHRLGNLLLRSLLNTIDADVEDFNDVNVIREYRTLGNGSLDLLIDSESITIGVENKIYASVYNNLDDYSKTIDHHASKNLNSSKKIYKLVLSLNPLPFPQWAHTGFRNVTYGLLWASVRGLLGKYADKSETKWLIY